MAARRSKIEIPLSSCFLRIDCSELNTNLAYRMLWHMWHSAAIFALSWNFSFETSSSVKLTAKCPADPSIRDSSSTPMCTYFDNEMTPNAQSIKIIKEFQIRAPPIKIQHLTVQHWCSGHEKPHMCILDSFCNKRQPCKMTSNRLFWEVQLP